jgi:hypothetical protein
LGCGSWRTRYPKESRTWKTKIVLEKKKFLV